MGKQWKLSDYFLGSEITADGDSSHEIKRCLLLGRKVMINLDSIFKSRDITLPTKVRLVKAMVFSSESTLRMRWPKYWSFSLSIIPSKEILGLISFRMDWLDLLGREETPWESPRDCQESSPTPHFKSVNFSALSILHSPTLTSIHDHWKKP